MTRKAIRGRQVGSALSVLLVLLAAAAAAHAQVCATPGADGDGVVLAGIVNTYYPGEGIVDPGATWLPVGAPTPGSAIASGDLLLVAQMQDAVLDSSNSGSYGDGVPGDPASGSVSLEGTGRYELVVALGAVTGGAVSVRGRGVNEGLVHGYASAEPTALRGQRTYQVVRVPQYASATLGSSLTASPWNGRTGGILAVDVCGTLDLGGATVSVDGRGFRGGPGRSVWGGTANRAWTDYVTLSTDLPNGAKAEGIAGSPSGLAGTPAGEGYPMGAYGRGAPGNAGGGGTDGNPAGVNGQNSGGGGGGNGGAGGGGGDTAETALPAGGFGGASVAAGVDRLVLGGGGGAGSANSGCATDGGTGGGMIFVRAGSVTGTGTLSAGGTTIDNPCHDGGGGGGAGGTIVVVEVSGAGLAGATLRARGGKGGDANRGYSENGPGGGGGGGVVMTSAAAGAVDVSGGASGLTGTGSGFAWGAGGGSPGLVVVGIEPAAIPGAASGAECRCSIAAALVPLPAVVCAGSSVTLDAAASTAANCPVALEYRFREGGTPLGTWTSDPRVTVSAGARTTYSLDVRCPTACGCEATIDVTVDPSPALRLDVPDGIESCPAAGPVTLGGRTTASGGTPPLAYLWSPAEDLDDPTSPNPKAWPLVTRTYTLVVTDAVGCSATASETVEPTGGTPDDLGNTLRALRSGSDAVFSWGSDARALTYNLKLATTKAFPSPTTIASGAAPAATHVGAVTKAPALLLYRATGSGCTSEGP